MLLYTPGPVPLPTRVRKGEVRHMISPRSDEFAALYREVHEGLQFVFQTSQQVLILSASGTGGMEALIVNLVSYGDTVLSVSCGAFGSRWAEIARAMGANVISLDFPPGKSVEPATVMSTIAAHPDIKLILVTHNETSTGVANNIAELASAWNELGASRPLLAVDAISSLGAIDLPVDRLGLDAVVAASQKALMAPPGLAFVSLSPRAWEAVESAHSPRYYWDLRRTARDGLRCRTPFTPAVSLLNALQESLRIIRSQGLHATFLHHRAAAQRLREGLHRIGLQLFADPAFASDTVTAVRVPTSWTPDGLILQMRTAFGIQLAGGMGYPIVRIGHMGMITSRRVDRVVDALENVIAKSRGQT